MGLETILAPTAEPVSLSQAKYQIRFSGNEHDVRLTGLIRRARQTVEGWTRRALVRQTWRVTHPCFPAEIELPISPVRSISSIQYVDTDGNTQTLATTDYQFDLITSDRARIKPAYGTTWPSTRTDTYNAVTVQFVAGYTVPFTTNHGGDINQLDAPAHPFSTGDALQVFNLDGKLPDGLAVDTNYYIVNSATDAFELSATSGGAPIDLVADGTGTQFAGLVPEELLDAILYLVEHGFENPAVITGTTASEMPFALRSLLMPHTSLRFG